MTIIFSDLHLETKSAPIALEALRRIPAVARARGTAHVIFTGDWWTLRHALPARLLLDARDAVRAWATEGIERFDVVVGNHDQTDLEGRNVLEVFEGLEAFVHVHTRPGWTPAGFMLPWRHSYPEAKAVLERAAAEIGMNHPPVLFAHIALRGAWMNNLLRDEEGVAAGDIVAMGWKRVFCGHYHRHHVVQKGVLYVGSPYQVSYAEAGQEKGVYSWNGAMGEFIPWDLGPRHHKVIFDADDPKAFAPIPNVRPGDKLWVVVRGQMAAAAQKAVSENLKALGMEPARIDLDLQPTTAAARIELRPEESRPALAQRFVQAQEIPAEYQAMLLETFRRVVAVKP